MTQRFILYYKKISVIMELELPQCNRLEKKNLDSFVERVLYKRKIIFFRSKI